MKPEALMSVFHLTHCSPTPVHSPKFSSGDGDAQTQEGNWSPCRMLNTAPGIVQEPETTTEEDWLPRDVPSSFLFLAHDSRVWVTIFYSLEDYLHPTLTCLFWDSSDLCT